MSQENKRYNKYSEFLRSKYGEKVYKIPINLPLTCPNRDGELGYGGCTFCGEVGTGFESQKNTISVKNQLENNIDHIKKRYGSKKFIAYFQNFTNTYLDIDSFKEYLVEACQENIVELCISSRPDCVHEEYLKVLKEISEVKNIQISFELGLQTINYHSLKKINRGHGLAEFIDAVKLIQKYGFEICAHLILNLPWDNKEDSDEAARVLAALGVKQIKIHSLYILKNTVLGNQYLNNEFEIITPEEYVDRVVSFIRLCPKDSVFQRFVGRAPKEESLFCNWDMSWWKVQDLIDKKLEEMNYYQGDSFNYLNGKAVKKFVNKD